MSHVLLDCSAYSSTRVSFKKKLQELLEDDNKLLYVSSLWICVCIV